MTDVGFGHWWLIIVGIFMLSALVAIIIGIIVASNVLTHRIINRKRN
jgi:hypothetical protein